MKRLIFILPMLFIFTGFLFGEVVDFSNNWGSELMFNKVYETPGGLEIIFSMHRMVISEIDVDGIPMKSFGFPGAFLPNDEGAPNVLGTGRYIAIPQNATAQVTILDSRTEVYHNVEVTPAFNIPEEKDNSPLVYEKDMSIYGVNAYYPSSPVKVSERMKIRGVDVVILGVTPFQYNPVSKELIVYKDIRIRIDFVGGNGHFGEDRLRSRFWEPILQGHLLNYNSLPKIDFYAPERIMSRDGYEYIIIVPDDPAYFEAWGDTIKAWRKLQGISCDVFTLTEVGGSSSAAIEGFLNNAYNTWTIPPAAFLLLSDYPSSGKLYGITSPMWNSHCVSDNIYADVDGNDLPDMHHARITAQNGNDLDIMINKFLSYERNPYTATNFYDEPLVACGFQTERWFQLASEIVRGFFANELGKSPVRQYAIYSGNPQPGDPWSTNTNTYMIVDYFGASGLGYIPDLIPPGIPWTTGNATGINAAINSGTFIVQHRDHGGYSGWGEPDYTLSDLNNLFNTMYPYVFSTNCLTGAYDYSSEVFAEKFHRIQYGALGINAASDVSYSFVNDTYIWGMYDCMWPQFDPGYGAFDMTGYSNLRPCQAMTYGKYYLQASGWPYNPQHKVYTHHLFHHHGDAFMTLYSEVPQNLTVSHPAVLNVGQTTFPVTANDSSIIALTVNGEIIGVAEGTGSSVNITIPPLAPPDTLKVTVTKANYYRYEADVPVIPGNYAYVGFLKSTIDDAAGGNGDGIANPGETIDWEVWVKNYGNDDASGVYGLLSISDSYIGISVDSSWYGNIPSGDSATGSVPYVFSIANECPDGYNTSFDLDVHDANDTIWYSHPSITVYAPVLTFQDYTVVDGNGILDPGETADLFVTIENEGGAVAENVTSTLTTSSSFITINNSSGNFGTIDPGNTANNSADPYNVTADTSTPPGSEVDFTIIVQAGVYNDTLDFTLVVGQSVPSDTGYYYVYYSGGPHSQSPVFDWIAIDSSQSTYQGISLDLGDDEVTQVNLPFTFTYYGLDYNQVTIGSDGWIAMGYQTTYDQTNSGIPNSDGPSAMIAGLWDDLDPGNIGQPSDIYYYYDTVNHRFIVEYFRVEHWPSGYHETFEIILYDPGYYPTPTGDGEIIVQYLLPMHQSDNTLGIENYSETIGIQYYYDGTYHELAVPVTDSFALKYTTYPPEYVGIEEEPVSILNLPKVYGLSNGYPNPCGKRVVINYQIPRKGEVSLRVYDVSGRLTDVLIDGVVEPGYHSLRLDTKGYASGVYFYRLVAGDKTFTRKMIVVK